MGIILTLTGISGAGKNTLAEELMRTDRRLRMIPSHTTRSPRPNDTPGEYVRITSKGLDALEARGDLLWRVGHGAHEYATMRQSVDEILCPARGSGIMILVPDAVRDLHTFLKAKKRSQARVSIFLTPPSAEVFWERIKKGGRDPVEVAKRHAVEQGWQNWVMSSGLGFHFVQNEGTIQETAARIRELLPL